MNRNAYVLLFVLLVCGGCGPGNALKGLVPATGTLTHEGEPVANARVLFRPVREGTAACGHTDAAGHFVLMSLHPGDGIRPGEYFVTVKKTEIRGDLRIHRPSETNQKIVRDEREIIEHLPEKYACVSSSELKITIPETGDTQIRLPLEGEVDLTPKRPERARRESGPQTHVHGESVVSQ